MSTRSASTPSRPDLRFVQAVRDEFAFLVDAFAFRLTSSAPPTWVRYEAHRVFVNVYHGRRSYEINVEIGLIDDPAGRVYRVADVIGALAAPAPRLQTYFQASDRITVRTCVRKAAALVREHYGPLLAGDAEAFARVAAYQSKIADAVTEKYVHHPTRQAAELAWQAKDLSRVRQLYEAIGEGLTPSERRRLEFARKRAGN